MATIKRNGTLRSIGIVVVILTALASAGGVVWTFGRHSGGLERAVKNIKLIEETVEKDMATIKEDTGKDIVEVKNEVKETKGRVRKVEDAVILIQSDISYIQSDVAKILKEVEK